MQAVFLFAIYDLKWYPFIIMGPPTFKVLLGIEQIWMMLELTLRIRQVKPEFKAVKNYHLDMLNYKRAERRIKIGRILIMVFEAVSFTVSSVMLIYMTVKYDLNGSSIHERTMHIDGIMGHYFFYYFIILLVSLLIAVVTLIYHLNKKGLLLSAETGQAEGLRQEIWQIGVILATMSLSLSLEIIWDSIFSCSCLDFKKYFLWQSSALFFVVLPIAAILFLHRKNFTAQEAPDIEYPYQSYSNQYHKSYQELDSDESSDQRSSVIMLDYRLDTLTDNSSVLG